MSRKAKAIWALRDLAVTLVRAKGAAVNRDGVTVICFRDARLVIELVPPIRGSSNPAQIDVWRIGDKAVKVFGALWSSSDELMLVYEPGDWEIALRAAATGRAWQGSDVPAAVARVAG